MAEVQGIGEMSANFRALKAGMETRISRLMVSAGGQVLKREAKAIVQANGSVITRALLNNIVIKREPQAPAGTTQYNLGVRHGRDMTKKQRAQSKLAVNGKGRIVVAYTNDPYYWSWVELGHRILARSSGSGVSAVRTYVQRLRNGEFAVRTAKYNTEKLRARRRRTATGGVPAKPFLRPALENNRDAIIKAMEDRLIREIDKAGKP